MRVPAVLRIAWALPVTLVGLLAAVLVRAGGGRVRRVEGVVEAGGGAVGRWMRRHTRIDAITLGHVVVGSGEPELAYWRAHEHAHVRQYERWGAAMPLLYLASSAIEALRGRDAYRRNVFERRARIAARRARRDAGRR